LPIRPQLPPPVVTIAQGWTMDREDDERDLGRPNNQSQTLIIWRRAEFPAGRRNDVCMAKDLHRPNRSSLECGHFVEEEFRGRNRYALFVFCTPVMADVQRTIAKETSASVGNDQQRESGLIGGSNHSYWCSIPKGAGNFPSVRSFYHRLQTVSFFCPDITCFSGSTRSRSRSLRIHVRPLYRIHNQGGFHGIKMFIDEKG